MRFRYETELGALPRAFHDAIEQSVRARLRHGPRGWEITDCVVTLTHSGFVGPLSTAADFRTLTPLVLDRALRAAGTLLLEPCHEFEISTPTAALAEVTVALAALGADIRNTTTDSAVCLILGTIPVRHVHAAQQQLTNLTHGEGGWQSELSGYRPIGARVP
ncbi:hypothetical protein [Nocardia sp. NPDC020380]|uniref:hypothetical protein n=1 Tax=Nocardia sp. NPDC020380 TaxID=3364309 RepID=UPI0037B837E8